jgi:hypothetical protein
VNAPRLASTNRISNDAPTVNSAATTMIGDERERRTAPRQAHA